MPQDIERQPLLPATNGNASTNGQTHDDRFANKVNTAFKYSVYKAKFVLLSNYANFLLVFVPLGIISGALGWPPIAIFVLNFIAIIPLAALLSFATEELSNEVGDTLGGLVNATFGNAVELIVSVVALMKGEIRIVQASMLGSILSNILLVILHSTPEGLIS
jgi:Ca2+:H+ antiporter